MLIMFIVFTAPAMVGRKSCNGLTAPLEAAALFPASILGRRQNVCGGVVVAAGRYKVLAGRTEEFDA